MPAFPSIFNDVIGPIMRGPSSSHCAAAVRIGRIARDLMDGNLDRVQVDFDIHGSLATTHQTQGSDMGLFGGLLGWDAMDVRLPDSEKHLKNAGIDVVIKISDLQARHPNTYRLTLENSKETHSLTAISTGGGMIEITAVDDFPVSIKGDYYETLIFIKRGSGEILRYLQDNATLDQITRHPSADLSCIQVKSQQPLSNQQTKSLFAKFEIDSIKTIRPVLPILSRNNYQVPFLTCREMIRYSQEKDMEMWELALHYEAARSALPEENLIQKMSEIVAIFRKSIHDGLRGTEYQDRILGYQSGKFQEAMAAGKLLDLGSLNLAIIYTTALMEMKSSMGVIVASPTAGACGGLPGACLAAVDIVDGSLHDAIKALFVAGLIGIFISVNATFAAEVGGCQAECGSASGMAAAALVSIFGGTTEQALAAASMALQNILGMICDPVANRVEVPCLGKNILAVSNAFSCANMALAGFDPVIPLDEVISTMDDVGKSLPRELRCTGLGGLSITKTSQAISRKINTRK